MSARIVQIPFFGALDIGRYPEVREAFAPPPLDARGILVDLREVTHVDSTFLTELLLYGRRLASEGVAFGILVTSRHVARIMALSNISKSIKIFTDYDQAMTILGEQTK